MVAVFGLIDFKEAAHLWNTDRTDFFMLLTTFLTTLGLGIEQGIIVGVVLSLAMVIYRSAYPHIASLGKVPNTNYYRNVERFPQAEQRPDILVIRFDAPLYFANSNYFKDNLTQMVQQKGPELKLVILNAEAISSLDSSAVHMLFDGVRECREAGVNINFAGLIGPVRDTLYKSGLIDLIGEDNIFMHVHDAVVHYDQDSKQLLPQNKNAVQSNVGSHTAQGNLWD
jgi:SulP family sulfate permease